jgi:hypothetical protein
MPYEWVIFIKRDNQKTVVTTGFYINCITEKLPFPDRSPRPQIGFKTLMDWNKKYRTIENEIMTIATITEMNEDKIRLLSDWQDFLAADWLAIVLAQESKNNEKWLNNTIRKFALKFLEHNEKLTEIEKETLKSNLKNSIIS